MNGIAQAQSVNPMPVTSNIDENGVDLINWSFSYSVAPISLGPSDQHPLTMSVYLPTQRDSLTTNLRIQDPSWVDSTSVTASLGPKSWSFLGGGGVDDPGAQMALFNDEAIIWARDGSTIEFVYPSWYLPGGTVGPVNFHASKITKPDGEILTFYDDSIGRVNSIVSTRGYQVKYDYPAGSTTDLRSKVTLINNAYEYCNPSAASCSLSMSWPSITVSTSGSGTSYTDNNGQSWTNASGGLISPGETVPGINWLLQNYNPPNAVGQILWRVTSITRSGKTWTYSYPSSDSILGGANGELLTVQDPLGNIKRYRRFVAYSGGDPSTGEFQFPNLLSKTADELGRVKTYDYTPQSSLPTTITLPEGNKYSATYDAAGDILTYALKAKPGSGTADATTTYTYGTWKDKPVTVTDANGNESDYTYDPVHGGVLTATGPAPTAGAPRPVKRYAYSQHYAWIKNSSGAYVQASSPIWMVDTEKTCRTGATVGGSCAAGASDEVTTSYDYGPASGPNNLWLRGKVVTADGVSLRTCYAYDPVGNKISETSPRAGLASCP